MMSRSLSEPRRRHALRAPVLVALATAALLTGCVSEQAVTQNTEQMLLASGFRVEPATTIALQNQLALLPSHRLVMRPAGADGRQIEYVYADPELCHCLLVGGPQQVQAFQNLAFQQRLADERMRAAQIQANAAFGWGPWSPIWGPSFAFAHHHRHHAHAHFHDHDHDHGHHHH